eukprot:gene22295-biopygen17717
MHPPIPQWRSQPEGATGKRITANHTRAMSLGVSRDSRWKARLVPELIRIIGPHFARAGGGSHRGANSQTAGEMSAPRRLFEKTDPPPPPPFVPPASGAALFCSAPGGVCRRAPTDSCNSQRAGGCTLRCQPPARPLGA